VTFKKDLYFATTLAKFNLKAEYFTQPNTVVLPGVILSVIGATVAVIYQFSGIGCTD